MQENFVFLPYSYVCIQNQETRKRGIIELLSYNCIAGLIPVNLVTSPHPHSGREANIRKTPRNVHGKANESEFLNGRETGDSLPFPNGKPYDTNLFS